jgi:hypothetical protein
MWGFASDSSFGAGDGVVTVPGPLLTVPVGDPTLTIHLDNNLSVPTSIMINGQSAAMTPVRNPDGRVRSFTHETDPNNPAPVDYTWSNVSPGTYIYQSATHPAVQVQMGLYGGVTKDFAAGGGSLAGYAYQNLPYEVSVPLFFSEIDPALHDAVDTGNYGPSLAMTSTIDYAPKYFLINGQAFVPGQAVVSAGTSGGGTLFRVFNMGLQTRCPLLQGAYMTLIAEDGQPYRYPREQFVLTLPAGKTIDAMVTFPAAGTYPIYDRRLGLTNAQARPGGMLAHLDVGVGNFWPVINSVTATLASILDIQTSQLLVTATDSDGPSPLSYSWSVPPGAGSLSDSTIANPVYTPPFAAGTNTYTLTVTVSDGTSIDIGTVDVTVTGYLVPVINSVTATPNPVPETVTSQLLVTATDPEGPSPLTYNWIVPPGGGSLSSTSVADPIYTPPDVTGDQIITITAEVFDGVTTVSDTVDVTVQDTGAPAELIVDNLDAGTSSSGWWGPSGASGFWATNSVYSFAAGSTFTFSANPVPGTPHAVYAWWTAAPNRDAATPYQISSGATVLGTVNVDQTTNGGQWNQLGIYTFSDVANVTVLANGGGVVSVADAVRFVPVTLGEVVVDNLDAETSSSGWWGASGASGFWAADSVYSFSAGSTFTFAPNLVPGTPYAVYAWWTAAPNRDTAAPYQISSGATLLGTVNVNQTTNGGQWNPLGVYTFDDIPSVTVLTNGGGVVTVADAVRFVPVTVSEVVVDNLDAETSSSGWWGASGAAGFWGTDSIYSFQAGATFTFRPNLVPGTSYTVYAWWTAAPNRDTAVPYEIRSGATLLGTVPVNQTTNGGQWNQLGVYTFGDIPSVTVLTNGGGVVSVADAVRFVPVP